MFGKLVSQARKRAKLTLSALADLVQEKTELMITYQSVQSWCNGTIPNSRLKLVGLCAALHSAGGLKTLEEINHLLLAAEAGALHQTEIDKWFPELNDASKQRKIRLEQSKKENSNQIRSSSDEIAQLLTRRLPSATYTKLFGVDKLSQQIGLALTDARKAPIVSIQGIGGIGKTALADHVVRIIMGEGKRFSDVLWVSAKQEYLTETGIVSTTTQMNLDLLFDDLGRQLELSEVARLPRQQKVQRLGQAIRANRYLVVIDNLETVRDFQIVVPHLERMTTSSRFLLTSREHVPSLTSVKRINLQELDEESSIALIRHTAESKEVVGVDEEEVYELVGGNPLAIILAVSLMPYLPPADVLRGLKKGETEAIYQYIYWKSWSALNEQARAIILTIQRAGDKSDWEWLEMMSDFEAPILRDGIQQLVRLSLVQPQRHNNGEVFYTIHRLTSTFLRTEVLKWK